jgi:hypothetical protein
MEPYCLAMVLCDYVHRDPGTNKCSILGTFNSIVSQKFPTSVEMDVYFALTDGFGKSDSVLKVVDVNDIGSDEIPPILEVEGILDFKNPLAVLEAVVHLNLELQKPGTYHVELYANSSVLMSRKLVAIQIQPEEKRG